MAPFPVGKRVKTVPIQYEDGYSSEQTWMFWNIKKSLALLEKEIT
jgi:hypothetical protein